MNIKALEIARNRLLEIHDAELPFDMDIWGSYRALRSEADLNPCGFAGCIVGWAAHQKWWEPLGFDLELQPVIAGDIKTWRPFVTRIDNMPAPQLPADAKPGYRQTYTIKKIADFLGLGVGTLERLILPEKYIHNPTAKDCAERITLLLSSGEDLFNDAIDEQINGEDNW